MRVLITGAAGFLGRNFTRFHWNLGDTVFGVDDLSAEHSYWPDELPRTNRFQYDAQKWFQDGSSHWDLAYHFAAPVGGREKIENDPLFNADSLRLDSLFFRWAIKHVTTAVYPSSSAVYGVDFQQGGAGSLSESMFTPRALTWHRPDQMYGFTKLAGEILAWKSADYGLNVLCIRPFSGYGDDQSLEYPVPSIAARVAKREDPLTIWGSGTQTRDFVHIADLIAATLARVEAGVHGYQTMNIGSGVATSFFDVARILAEIAGYQPEIVADLTKPEGVKSRWANIAQMNQYYHLDHVPLTDGLAGVLRAHKEGA